MTEAEFNALKPGDVVHYLWRTEMTCTVVSEIRDGMAVLKTSHCVSVYNFYMFFLTAEELVRYMYDKAVEGLSAAKTGVDIADKYLQWVSTEGEAYCKLHREIKE